MGDFHFHHLLNKEIREEIAQVKFYLLKKQKVFFDNKECQLLVFRDVTAFRLLEEERSKVKLMQILHATVSHEMLNPMGNIEVFAQ